MYSTSISGNVSGLNGGESAEMQMAEEIAMQRQRTQETAQRLSLAAMRQWEKALTGIAALPAAAALSTAATMLYTTAIIERGFEIFEMSVGDLGKNLGRTYENGGRRSRRDGQDLEKEARQ